MRGHENHFAASYAIRVASDADFRHAFEHLHECIERGRVLAQVLSFIECEDGYRAGWSLDDFAADDRAVPVVHQLGGLRDFGAESCGFRLSRSFHVVFLIVHGLAVRWRVLLRRGHARLIDWVYIEVFTL